MAGGGSSDTTQKSTVPKWMKPYYQNLFKDAYSAYQGGFFEDQMFGGQSGVAGFDPSQVDALNRSISSGQNIQSFLEGPGMAGLEKTLSEFDPNDPSLVNSINAALNENTTAFSRDVLPALRGNAMASGVKSSARAGVAEALAASDLNRQNLNTAATMTGNAYGAHESARNNALMNLSSIAQGLNAGNQVSLAAGTSFQDQRQKEINDAMQQWAYENDIDLKNMQAFSSILSGSPFAVNKASGGGGGGGIMELLGGIMGGMG